MTVPSSKAVAKSVTLLLSASAEMGTLYAQIICEMVRDLVKNSRMSPDAALAEEG
jgi:hypothetical protein